MTLVHPDRVQFRNLAREYDLIPVYREIVADMETPVSAFHKLQGGPYRFLLESVEGGQQLGRYSILGSAPHAAMWVRGDEVTVETPEGTLTEKRANPLRTLADFMGRHRVAPVEGLPRFFGGAVGYLGYEAVRYFEPRIPVSKPDSLGVPDAFFLLTYHVVVFDHVRQTIQVVVNARPRPDEDADAAHAEACAAIDAIIDRLRQPNDGLVPLGFPAAIADVEDGAVRSNVSREEFCRAVRRAKDYLAEGDIFQVVLSRRLTTAWDQPPLQLYRALRTLNPSPYMFFLDFGSFQLVGASPEVMARAEDGAAWLRPLAGTRPRGATGAADDQLAADLLADEKERAEHAMLVDLGRNDLARVCEPGSVQVDQLMEVERYSHVMHIVSNVVGTLAPGRGGVDVLQACFPAGTLTGAPKVRAMEVIDELEPSRRGPYGGAVCYFSFTGNMDSCITIRTALIKDGEAHVQAGAGIVLDSDPETEFQETENKAKAVLKAIALSKGGAVKDVSHHR